MKFLIVSVAGLGWRDLKQRKLTRLAGLDFSSAESAFPALTCVSQASLRTGLKPVKHGMVSNAHFSRALQRPMFWEQSAALIKGKRIWEAARNRDETLGVALFFFQQSLGETADLILSPAPIHKHHGGMIEKLYVTPPVLDAEIGKANLKFPLKFYWGPLADAFAGELVLNHVEYTIDFADPEISFVYLPTLDYDLQRHGPDSVKADEAFRALEKQLARLAEFAKKTGRELVVIGEYGITQVTEPPVFPNVTLRKFGHFKTREVNGMWYPDFYASNAFAVCDHEIAHVYVKDSEDLGLLQFVFETSGEYDVVERRAKQNWAHASAGELLLVAKQGSWCAYPWWDEDKQAPEYATHVDIHNKPGYDPCELFFGRLIPPGTSLDWGKVKGTHGRECEVALASTVPLPDLPPFPCMDDVGVALNKAFKEVKSEDEDER